MKLDHISEEKIVDYVLGNLSHVDYFTINTHLKHCQKCHLQVLSWQKLLQAETDKQLNAPAKQQVYNTFFQKQRLKRSRLTFILASLCLVVLCSLLFVSQQNSKSLIAKNIPTKNSQTFHQQKRYVNAQHFADLNNLFLQTTLQSQGDEKIKIPIDKRAKFPLVLHSLNEITPGELLVINNDKMCVINNTKTEMICFTSFSNEPRVIVPLEISLDKYLNH